MMMIRGIRREGKKKENGIPIDNTYLRTYLHTIHTSNKADAKRSSDMGSSELNLKTTVISCGGALVIDDAAAAVAVLSLPPLFLSFFFFFLRKLLLLL